MEVIPIPKPQDVGGALCLRPLGPMVASSRRLLQPSCCAACVLTQYRTCSGLNAIKAHLASSEADEDSYSSSQSARRAREYGSEESSDSGW